MFLLLHRLFNIPVYYSRLFGRDLPEGEFGQVLEGDSSMPPTFVSGWPAWANVIRNAFLAIFVWREYSVLDVGDHGGVGVYLMFGEAGSVMPRRIYTRYIIVKHGREACRFAVIDATWHQFLRYDVVGRGRRDTAVNAAYAGLAQQLRERRGLWGDKLFKELSAVDSGDVYTFV